MSSSHGSNWYDQSKCQMKDILIILVVLILSGNQALPISSSHTIKILNQGAFVNNNDSIPYDSIRTILEDAHDSDQKIREKLSAAEGSDSLFMSYLGEMTMVDRKNREKVLPILEKYGWLPISKIGEKASDGLFYVLQHYVDLDLFRKYLPVIKKLSEKNEAKLWHAALIEDRLLVHENKKQIYGSQVVSRKGKYGGDYFVWPIREPAKVNSLREQVGLPLTVEENAKRLNAIYDPEESIPYAN